MKGWLLEIETPAGNWCQDIVAQFPNHQVRVNMMVPTSGLRCMETVTITGPDVERVEAALLAHPHVVSVMVAGRDQRTLQLRLVLRGCPVADVTRTTGLAPRLPFVVVPERDIWMVMGQDDALDAARARLRENDLATTVLAKHQWSGLDADLTEHQRTVLARAVQSGYYEYPRKTTLTDLAYDLGVAKSTLSQTLMVIEMKLVADFFHNPPYLRLHGRGAGAEAGTPGAARGRHGTHFRDRSLS